MTRHRPTALEALQVFALFSLALAHPVLDMLSRSPDALLSLGVTPVQLCLLVAIPCFVMPALVVGLELLLWRWSPMLRCMLRLAVVAEASGVLALHLFLAQGWGLHLSLAAAGLVAVSAGSGYLLSAHLRSFCTALAPATIVVPFLFFSSPVVRGVMAAPAESSGPTGTMAKASVLVLVFDELPLASLVNADLAMDPVRFPHFAALARQSIWFRNASTVGVNTVDVIPALLTGRNPDGRTMPLARYHPDNLFTLLAPSHRLEAREAVSRLAPVGQPPRLERDLLWEGVSLYERWLLPASLRRTTVSDLRPTPYWDEMPAGYRPEEEVQRFREFVAGIRGDGGPTLRFYHCVLPHAPWNRMPSGEPYGSSYALPPHPTWSRSSWQVTHGMQRHLLQVAFVDRLLGQVVARLRQQGLYDQTLVVVTADHGSTFAAGAQGRELVPGHVDELLRVPLLVKLPGARVGEVRDVDASLVDVLPTVAELLSVRVSWRIDGRSLLAGGAARPRFFLQRSGLPETPPDLPQTVARWNAAFGPDFGPRFWAVGPYPTLVGQRLGGLPRGPARDGFARLERGDEVASDAQLCVEGVLNPGSEALPEGVALVIRGRVAALSGLMDGGRLAAMLPPSTRGRISVYAVERGGKLRPLRTQ